MDSSNDGTKPSEKLKQLRIQSRYTLRDLAKILGVAPSTYRGWENGRKVPSAALQILAQTYDVPLAEILGVRFEQNDQIAKALFHFDEGVKILKSLL